ncbi:sarcosine oxidase [Corchorus olitorius]|uniref:Sarcosine oxidase n=1 Tax=Corchorus olitorius TaxID=93759 RepID=A0A1R3HBQ8_9ROSI|nr:sarcosine oxidase [Corchorus olitorius]
MLGVSQLLGHFHILILSAIRTFPYLDSNAQDECTGCGLKCAYVIDFLGGEFGKDVVIGGGFSSHGFKMAPAIGRIPADLVLYWRGKWS